MKKFLIIPKNIVTANPESEILKNHAVEISGNKISKIARADEFQKSNYEKVLEFPNLTLIPGFVQTHIHLCQTLFRGLADDLQLLDWLQKKIFPFENAHNENSLKYSVKLGINELISGGTTTILDMGTLKHQEIIFEELMHSGMRAIAGKCLMDVNNLYPKFKETTEENLNSVYSLAKEFHNEQNGKIKYAFAPRFALSCNEKLLKESKAMMKDFPGSIYHTHASENKGEIEEVRKRFGKENIEFFESENLLDKNTVLAHCIHLNEKEINILKNNETAISHCPSSNLKLASGIANIPYYLKKGIKVSLGADGAPCNNNLSQFVEMRLAALIQKPVHGADEMDAKKVFHLATIDGAKALNLQDEIGSIEEGKKADLVLLDLEKSFNSLSDDDGSIYSNIVYTSGKENVNSVMIDGEWKILNGENLVYDENQIYSEGKVELKNLLKRINE